MLRMIAFFSMLTLACASALAAPPTLPATPSGVNAVLYSQPFKLNEAYRNLWRNDTPMVAEGLLVVFEVDPDLVYPRQTEEPVLYVDDETAMRLNVGYPSGRVVAIVPNIADLDGRLVWFGTPRLPESVTPEIIAAERAMAQAAGIQPRPAWEVSIARSRGAGGIAARDLNTLLVPAAALVRRYSPDETDIADTLANQSN